jgi:hypothetical protein
MSDMLKGNYKIKDSNKPESKADLKKQPASLEENFESKAMEKLGGSMAFVKKSSSFIWKGDKSK